MVQHKSGSLKQSNKKHKNKGSTRPSKENHLQGRVEKASARKELKVVESKLNRVNRSKQLINEKKSALLRSKTQLNSSLHRIVALIPLVGEASPATFIKMLEELPHEWTRHTTDGETQGKVTFYSKSQKCLYSFLYVPEINPNDRLRENFIPNNLIQETLEILSVSDFILFLSHYENPEDAYAAPLIDDNGVSALKLIVSYGVPRVLLSFTTGVIQEMSSEDRVHINFRTLTKSWKHEFDKLFNLVKEILVLDELKFYDVIDKAFPVALDDVKTNSLRWRYQRSYLVTDSVQCVETNQEKNECVVKVRGVLRGAPLYINSLINITNVGVGKLHSVTQLKFSNNKNATEDVVSVINGRKLIRGETLKSNEAEIDSLDTEAVPDSLMGEQTWPEDHEFDMIPAQNEEDDYLLGMNEEDRADYESYFNNQLTEEDLKNKDGDSIIEDDDNILSEKKRIVNDEDDEHFYDYFDLSPDEKGGGKERLARYRALQSFRNSYWNPKEILPEQYGRVFQFEDFKGLQKSICNTIEELKDLNTEMILNKNSKPNKKLNNNNTMDIDDKEEIYNDFYLSNSEDHFVCTDQYVELIITNVPLDKVNYRNLTHPLPEGQSPHQQSQQQAHHFILFSLHTHENKLSVCHYTINRNVETSDLKVKSKEVFLFYNGFRSYLTKPIFSESNLNCDKHKYYKYLPAGGFSVASCLGPVSMTEAPILVFRVEADLSEIHSVFNISDILSRYNWTLIASGNLLSVDPDRIILKKKILTGNPIRVRRRGAVVKHMFYNPLDVRWFKPAELATLHGLRGHIKESVGTHGLFKAIFSGPIKQNDQVMLILYKRVFPKFP